MEMIRVHNSNMKDDKKNVKILIEDRRFLGKKYRDIIKDKQDEVFGIYKKKLEEIECSGSLRKIDHHIASFSILGMLNWLYQWYNPKGRMNIEEITDHMIKMILYGLIEDNRSKSHARE